ncbi:60S acidic ribosomal protein P1-like [Stegodyphus dumicola]|uniref:60S acidic ribosomal protein P1-like n=1 Tax=Stegodyphus dumicola TaxID=202533 RepID=UPI0015AE3C4B|nr:60S acidic ribosomal protein P1-like [Stegodyphus dumicola]
MLTPDEVACVYSALILQDDDIAVTAEKINTILKAAGVDVEPYWPTLFAKALEGVDLKQLITNVSAGVGGMGGGVPAAPGAPAAGAEAPAAKEEAKKEEKKEESEESDEDMGFGLFD